MNFACATSDTHIQKLNEKWIEIKNNSFYIIEFERNVWEYIKHRTTHSKGSTCPQPDVVYKGKKQNIQCGKVCFLKKKYI